MWKIKSRADTGVNLPIRDPNPIAGRWSPWLLVPPCNCPAAGYSSALAFALLLYLTAREFGVRPDWAEALALLAAISPLVLQYAL